jgi:indole-3-glycerol phosphate synthase
MGILDRIIAQKRAELTELRHRRLPSPPALRPAGLARNPNQPLRILAEIKHRSPSAGALSKRLSVGERAACYERAGASMVSVLCDVQFFDGSFEHLALARSSSSIPLLCKEFVIDECQLDCARAYGADAVLLIVRCLQKDELQRLFSAAVERGLQPLVEVATEAEAQHALDVGATTIGVNARDLDTLAMDPARAATVLRNLPKHITKLHLSGLSSPPDVERVRWSGADGALVGEILMRQDDPTPLLSSLVAAAQ